MDGLLNEEEILSHEQLIELFDEKRLSKSPSTFDKNKLSYINNRYIKALEDEELLELCMPHLVEAGILEGKTTAWAMELISLFHDRLSYGAEIVDLYDDSSQKNYKLDEEASAFIAQEGVAETLKAFKSELEALEDFNAEGIQVAVKALEKQVELKGKCYSCLVVLRQQVKCMVQIYQKH